MATEEPGCLSLILMAVAIGVLMWAMLMFAEDASTQCQLAGDFYEVVTDRSWYGQCQVQVGDEWMSLENWLDQ